MHSQGQIASLFPFGWLDDSATCKRQIGGTYSANIDTLFVAQDSEGEAEIIAFPDLAKSPVQTQIMPPQPPTTQEPILPVLATMVTSAAPSIHRVKLYVPTFTFFLVETLLAQTVTAIRT